MTTKPALGPWQPNLHLTVNEHACTATMLTKFIDHINDVTPRKRVIS